LDKEDYQYAFVSGHSLSYLWLLSRKPRVSQEIIERFIEKSTESGFDFCESRMNLPDFGLEKQGEMR
jgi:lipocalin